MLAVISGYYWIVVTLLRNEADVNLQNNKGMTALMYAAQKGRLALVNKLLQYGADAFIVNTDNNTAQHLTEVSQKTR